jgi:hypothetical protein
MIADGSRFVMDNLRFSDRLGWLTYGSYYAGVAHYLMGGEKWKTYYESFGRQYLLTHVNTEGDMSYWSDSMDPNAKGIGSNWCTAVFTTILSLPYGYLPLYQR